MDWLEIARGNVPGFSTTVIRGHNPSQTSASGYVTIAEMGSVTYLTTAETMNISSDNAADDTGGVGLITVLVQGVDNTGAAVQEVVTLNGTADVLTTNSYLRVNNMVGLTVGSTEVNVGVITATASSAATIQDEMNAGEGISQSSTYTVPLGFTFYVTKIELNCAKITGGASPEVEFTGQARSGGAGNCWIQLFDKRLDTGIVDELDVILSFPAPAPERSDIRVRANVSTDSTETRSRMYGILVDDLAT